MTGELEIIVNGEKKQIPGGWTIQDLISALGPFRGPVATEVNENLIRRDRWIQSPLKQGDRVEIVHFVGGGSL